MRLVVRFMMVALAVFVADVSTAQNIQVSEDAGVSAAMQRYMADSKANQNMKGYRIQIITTDDRRKMEAAQSKFKAMYPEIFLDWEHVVPYYKIKVAGFRSKLDLQPFLVELREHFPSAIPIVDDIHKRELLF